MKKIILTTAISALLSTSAFAGITGGDIDFGGSIVNPSCEVTVDGAHNSFKVFLGTHERNLFGPKEPIAKIASTKKPFEIVAKGFDCDKSTLTLKAHTPHASLDGVYWGHDSVLNKLAFYMENSVDNKAVKLDGATVVEASSRVHSTTLNESQATYKLGSYLYNDGAFPEVGTYTARVSFLVVNP